MALGLLMAAKEILASENEPVEIRVGIHTGPILAGIIGESRFHYKIVGQTVNTASRIQGHAEPGTRETVDNGFCLKLWRMVSCALEVSL
jgi:class 3 adenylate cyclase